MGLENDFPYLVNPRIENGCIAREKIGGKCNSPLPLGFIFPTHGKLRSTLNAPFLGPFCVH